MKKNRAYKRTLKKEYEALRHRFTNLVKDKQTAECLLNDYRKFVHYPTILYEKLDDDPFTGAMHIRFSAGRTTFSSREFN